MAQELAEVADNAEVKSAKWSRFVDHAVNWTATVARLERDILIDTTTRAAIRAHQAQAGKPMFFGESRERDRAGRRR